MVVYLEKNLLEHTDQQADPRVLMSTWVEDIRKLRTPRKQSEVDLWPPHNCTCVHMHTYIDTH